MPRVAPYFMDYVSQAIENRYGQGNVGRLGLTITTTLDLQIQQVGEEVVRKQVSGLRSTYNLGNAALVAPSRQRRDHRHGRRRGLPCQGQRRPGQCRHQPAPTRLRDQAHPLLPGFHPRLQPGKRDLGHPGHLQNERHPVLLPVNYDGKFHGPVRLRTALANSLNVPAVKLLSQVGVPDMVPLGRSMGLQGLDHPAEHYGLSVTLGGAEVTLLSLTNAYATIDNGGRLAPTTPIIAIRDSVGKVIDGHKPSAQVVDPRAEYLVTSILSDNEARTMEFGANSPLHLSRPAAAKTGTTTDFRDNWTVGYTPYLTVGVWAGNTDGTPMRNTTGLTAQRPSGTISWKRFSAGRSWMPRCATPTHRWTSTARTEWSKPQSASLPRSKAGPTAQRRPASCSSIRP